MWCVELVPICSCSERTTTGIDHHFGDSSWIRSRRRPLVRVFGYLRLGERPPLGGQSLGAGAAGGRVD